MVLKRHRADPAQRVRAPLHFSSSASGLLWIAEVIEEHTKLAKKIGRRSIYVRHLSGNENGLATARS